MQTAFLATYFIQHFYTFVVLLGDQKMKPYYAIEIIYQDIHKEI